MPDHLLSQTRGFLKDQFRIFYLKDKQAADFEFHSHGFHKAIVFLQGDVQYHVEGITYDLEQWDLLLISEGEIHRPVINNDTEYERLILWIHEETLKKLSLEGDAMSHCFEQVKLDKDHRISRIHQLDPDMKPLVMALMAATRDSGFGNIPLRQALVVQWMVHINRLMPLRHKASTPYRQPLDPRIPAVLEYINDNLSEDLSIHNLSNVCYLSRYYLMHQFKSQTGFTLHQYIQTKRLDLANQLIRQGKSYTESAYAVGFKDYSSFLRAYKKQFKASPKHYHKKSHFDLPSKEQE
jgi:AraC-like DNA-binding protein/quercetin dioxygenase-like cupin family protein